jgi:hypothetical protein
MHPIRPSQAKELLVLKVGNDVLFQEPTVSMRRLRRSVVLATSQDSISVRFVGEPFAFELEQEVLMYFSAKREFMQQIGRIVSIDVQCASIDPAAESVKEGPVFTLEPIGDPISAEARQNYRVSTISAGIQAWMGTEANLQVQDLSATGFAVLADRQYAMGQVLEVSVRHGEEACHGLVSIQSFRELESGRLRYGLRAIEKDPHAKDFLATLQRISLAVQREQLQRSGAAR